MKLSLIFAALAKDAPILKFDRNKAINPAQPALTYQLIANWMIAERKSQGLFQMNTGRD
ncbi:MAG: hypothetical protein JST80_00890 [Bdellovibrionales bacterium]|nr:hypothetical protein [Bdellovibrionales bacterium]